MENLLEKYGNLWTLRDLDFLPEKLETVMENYRCPFTLSEYAVKSGFVFGNELDAVKASMKVYMVLGKPIPDVLMKKHRKLIMNTGNLLSLRRK